MTEHLQECWAKYPSDPPAWCICDELRACEARVHEAAYQAGKAYGLTVNGYNKGLNAARKAVAALATKRELRSPSGLDIDIHEAIAAIDALKEEQ